MRFCSVVLAISVLVGVTGCGGGSKPLLRLGCYPSPTAGTTFPDPQMLGTHSYSRGGSDRNGIVYTCRGGHIDLAHLRIAADWTMYLTDLAYKSMMRNERTFAYRSKPAPSRYYVELEYPAGWAGMSASEKERLAREASLRLGEYLAFLASTWHEIVTWFGYKFVAVLPEFSSSFSWEDNYSNLLGTRLAAAALRDVGRGYDEAMTIALDKELADLGVQPRRVAIWAGERMRGQWFTGHVVYMVKMKRRNFDIGLDDGYVSPTVVPELTQCRGAQAKPYPVPSLGSLNELGFKARVKIKPKIWESKKILNIAYGGAADRGKLVDPSIHFGPIMDYIKQDAPKRIAGLIAD
ncbi:MAG: DUF4056 domain-containing protein [Sedimentisphaerales bacterium]|nr:DUF4056 domain-containing protein [Sedimentisphaerales bacterium]